MEVDSPLYRDIAIAAHFGKWPSEWYALPLDEQELLRYWYSLMGEKTAYGYLSEEDRHYWPQEPPKRQ